MCVSLIHTFSLVRSDNLIHTHLHSYTHVYTHSLTHLRKYTTHTLTQARSGPCLLDCIKLELTEVDVFSAQKIPPNKTNYKIVRQVIPTT